MVSTIQEVETDTGNRFNDGKCDAKGRLWAGKYISFFPSLSAYFILTHRARIAQW